MAFPPNGQSPNRIRAASPDSSKEYSVLRDVRSFPNHFDAYILGVPIARQFIPNEDTGYYHPSYFVSPQSNPKSVGCFGFNSSMGRPDHVSNMPLRHKDANVNPIMQTYNQGALFMDIAVSQMPASMSPPLQPNIVSTPVTPAVVRPMPRGHKFECETCHRTFDRPSRLENCRNRHLGVKPHKCMGRCGSPRCPKEYAFIDHLDRHIQPYGACTSCGESHLKQNMSRHRDVCAGRQKGKL